MTNETVGFSIKDFFEWKPKMYSFSKDETDEHKNVVTTISHSEW